MFTRPEIAMLLATLEQDNARAFDEWCEQHVRTEERMRELAVALAAFAASSAREVLGDTRGATFVMPPLTGDEPQPEIDAMRMIVFLLNRDTPSAFAVLHGVIDHGCLPCTARALASAAHLAVTGNVIGEVL